jgi:lysophospholipase L1-like esterase
MLRTLLLSLAIALPAAAQSPVTNQHLFDTTAFIPDHGARRMALFAREPVVRGGILFLGDSITEGGQWGELLGDPSVVNRGIGGDITFGVMKRLDEVIRRAPSKLFLLIGVNDIGKDIPDAVIADNVRKIIQRLQAKSPGTAFHLQSILPVNPEVRGFPQHYDKQSHVMNTNRLLRIVASATGVDFVDLYSVFLDAHGRLDARYTNDGLHLNSAGYEIWVKHLKDEGHL